jgi:hypothetical protein
MMIDAYVFCLRDNTIIQKNIPVSIQEMDTQEATAFKAQSPNDAVWIYTLNSDYDIKQGDVLVDEKDSTIKYHVFARVRTYKYSHNEIPAEQILIPITNIAPSSAVKVLIVFANPRSTDPLRLGTEDRIIQESIKLSRYRDNIALKICHAATTDDLRRSLLEESFQIVHISGHGAEEGLVLESQSGEEYIVPKQALANLLKRYSPPLQCVILNACHSTMQAQLISLGVPFTIAMEGPIDDVAAIEFSKGFYDSIGAGGGIELAFKEGCDTAALNVPEDTEFSPELMTSNNKQFTNITSNSSQVIEATSPPPIDFRSDSWQNEVLAKLKEYILLWTLVYGTNVEKLSRPSNIQSKLILISEQLLEMLARSPKTATEEVTNNIGIMAAKLSDLGRKEFEIDGGLSLNEFNELGDTIFKDAENVMEQMQSYQG